MPSLLSRENRGGRFGASVERSMETIETEVRGGEMYSRCSLGRGVKDCLSSASITQLPAICVSKGHVDLWRVPLEAHFDGPGVRSGVPLLLGS